MRSRMTWLVVAAVGGLAFAAILDAVADREPDADGETETVSTMRVGATEPAVASPTAAALSRAGVSGVLYATFRSGPRCEYRAMALPSVELVTSGSLQRCRFAVSPDGRYIAEVARCPDNRATLVRSLHSDVADVVRGCSAAWKPDAALTYLLRGRLVVANRDCLGRRGCGHVAVPRAALAHAVRSIQPPAGAASVRQIVWLTDSRLAIVVQTRWNTESVVLLEGRAAVRIVGPRDFGGFPLHSHLEVVKKRKEIFVGGRGYGGFAVFDFSGDFVDANPVAVQDAAATAHSPDGRWIALARPGNVCIYPQDESRSIGCIRGDAQDLAWR